MAVAKNTQDFSRFGPWLPRLIAGCLIGSSLAACTTLPRNYKVMPQFLVPHRVSLAPAADEPTAATPAQPLQHPVQTVIPAIKPTLKQRTVADLNPKVVTPRKPLQCVPYARNMSNIQIKGNASTWWQQAEGKYRRGRMPMPGGVMVLGPKNHSTGHVAVVTEMLDERTIVVNHANWLNDGKIYKSMPVVDVSPKNDWSSVRIWYEPGDRLGATSYPVKGFIYPETRYAQR